MLNRGVEGDVRHVKDAVVAVFASGIDMAKTETKGGWVFLVFFCRISRKRTTVVRMTKAEELLEFSTSEEKLIEKVIGEILESGVNVLVSGGAIGEMAMHFIEKAGVMVVK